MKMKPDFDYDSWDWDTIESYLAHFQGPMQPCDYHDAGRAAEIAFELGSVGELIRMLIDTHYDLDSVRNIGTIQMKKIRNKNGFRFKNRRGNNKKKLPLQFADWYWMVDFENTILLSTSGKEIKNLIEKDNLDSEKDIDINFSKIETEVIWSGNVWKTLQDDKPTWFDIKDKMLYDLWNTCKNNVKQQSPLGAFIE